MTPPNAKRRSFPQWVFGRIGLTFPIPKNMSVDLGRVIAFEEFQGEGELFR
jgi:hypothetical protein